MANNNNEQLSIAQVFGEKSQDYDKLVESGVLPDRYTLMSLGFENPEDVTADILERSIWDLESQYGAPTYGMHPIKKEQIGYDPNIANMKNKLMSGALNELINMSKRATMKGQHGTNILDVLRSVQSKKRRRKY